MTSRTGRTKHARSRFRYLPGVLRIAARHEQRRAQMRYFLLDAAGIADDERGARRAIDEVTIIHGLDERYVGAPTEMTTDGCRYARIGMHRKNDLHIGTRFDDVEQRTANDPGVAIVILAPVQRHENTGIA